MWQFSDMLAISGTVGKLRNPQLSGNSRHMKTTILAKNNGTISYIYLKVFLCPPSPSQCCYAAVFMYSLKDPSSYQHCDGEGGVSENDDESSNKVMETAYRCVK